MNDDGKLTPEEAQEEFKGATIPLARLRRADGLLAQAIDKQNMQKQGVVQTFITAVEDDKNYRQIIKLARWRSDKHRELYIKALNECRITGAWNAFKFMLDMVTAQAAGEDAALMHEAAEALTHTTFTSREETERRKRFGIGRYGNNSKPTSILS